jgi:hypothetical protein
MKSNFKGDLNEYMERVFTPAGIRQSHSLRECGKNFESIKKDLTPKFCAKYTTSR